MPFKIFAVGVTEGGVVPARVSAGSASGLGSGFGSGFRLDPLSPNPTSSS